MLVGRSQLYFVAQVSPSQSIAVQMSKTSGIDSLKAGSADFLEAKVDS